VVSLGVVAGGRAGANTATAVADLLAGAERAGASTTHIELAADHGSPIGDCAASVGRGRCDIDDRFAAIMEQVAGADLLVLGTPLYWYGPSAQLKAFLDRWSCLLDLDEAAFRAHMRDKAIVFVIAQGERGFYEATPCLQMLEWTARYVDARVLGRVVVVGHARDDYASDADLRERVIVAGEQAAQGRPCDVQPPWFHLRHTPGAPLGGIYPA
jgi:multimeric flavodoxin WrbA